MTKPLTQQAGAVFAFLRAVQELKNRPVPSLGQYASVPEGWVHHLADTPRSGPGLDFWVGVADAAMGALGGDVISAGRLAVTALNELDANRILRVARPNVPAAPEPPAEVGPWLESDFEDERATQQLSSFILVDSEGDDEESRHELVDHPDVQDAFLDWLLAWELWAKDVREQAALRRLYERVFAAREQLKNSPEEWELVLGVGRLCMPSSVPALDRHLFTVNCVVDLDAATGTLFVRRDDLSPWRVEDEWIIGIPKPDREALEELCAQLNDVEGLPEIEQRDQLVAFGNGYRSSLCTDLNPPVSAQQESLLLAPSLILRKRGRRELIELLNAIESQVVSDADIPPPLRALLDPSFGEQAALNWSSDGAAVQIDDALYLPLKLNTKQLAALRQADTRHATIIQGPPGTGKTRTIAVMVSHFLARGQRVLVVAETSQALKEVRHKLPEEVRDLAVAKLGSGAAEKDDLQKAVNALNAAYEDKHDLVDAFPGHESRLLSEIDFLHRERASHTRAILDIRSREATSVTVEGLEGTPARLTLIWLELRDTHGWIDDVTDDNVSAINMTSEQLTMLTADLQRAWSQILEVPSDRDLLEEAALFDEAEFEELIRLRSVEFPSVAGFKAEGAQELLTRARHIIGEQEALDLDEAVWAKAAVAEALAGRRGAAVSALPDLRAQLTDAREFAGKVVDFTVISCPPSSLAWLPIVRALRDQVSKKGPLALTVSGAWKPPLIGGNVLKAALSQMPELRLRGQAPSTDEDLQRFAALIEFDHCVSTFCDIAGLPSAAIPKDRLAQSLWIERQIAVLDRLEQLLEQIFSFYGSLKKQLKSDRRLDGDIDLPEIARNLQSVVDHERLGNLREKLRRHKQIVADALRSGATEVEREYASALNHDDPDRFSAARSAMVSLCRAASVQRQANETVASVFNEDATLLRTGLQWAHERPDPDRRQELQNKLDNLLEALRWKRLGQALGSTDRSEYLPHFQEIRRVDGLLEQKVSELARRRAWKRALERIDATTVTQMQRYAYEQRRLGAGTGKRAAQQRREIRQYLKKCIPAIPAWIMPISEVARTFPRDLASFDVVIVDEASQASLSSLFLLALAKRAVIVGDHKQVSPEDIGLKVDEVAELANRLLKDMSQRANWTNIGLSLFDECRNAIPNMITLTEHRRCVPRIIGFSNEIAYIPENIRLIPVRQVGTGALPPVEMRFVAQGYMRGESASVTNPPEADAIADEISHIISDPNYRNMTLGVIVLQGSAQAELIQKRVSDRIDPAEYERRQLKFGNPSAFQGAERNVILLSMVTAPNRPRRARTSERDVQRFNVAVSRAQDQVILFHSLKSTDITNVNDLNRRLLDYCEKQVNGVAEVVAGSVGLVTEDLRVAPFDSLFEQRVHNRIVSRDHIVIPQYRPEIDGHDYRIDLVVVGRHGKLAVECDGEYFHGGLDQMREDQIRQEILESSGWRFFRVPESEFYLDPDSALDELWPMLDQLGKISSVDESPIDLMREALGATVNRAELFAAEVSHDAPVQTDEEDRVSEIISADGFELKPVLEVPIARDKWHSRSPESVVELIKSGGGLAEPGAVQREYPKPEDPRLGWIERYDRWIPSDGLRPVSISSGSSAIWRDLIKIIEIEGPILGAFLIRRHYKASGGSSLSATNESTYLGHLRQLIARGEVIAQDQDAEGTLASATFRLPNQPPVRTRVPGDRTPYDVPPREVAAYLRNSRLAFPELAHAGNSDELFRRVLELLGSTRLTKKAQDHLERIVLSFHDELSS